MASSIRKRLTSVFFTVLFISIAWFTYQRYLATKYKSYVIYYKDVKGVQPSSPVLLRGARIGKIESIKIEHADLVKIVIRVSGDVTLHTGATAQIKSTGLISDKSINIIDGNSALVLNNGAVLITDTTSAEAKAVSDVATIKTKVLETDSFITDYNKNSTSLKSFISGISALSKTLSTYASSSSQAANESEGLHTDLASISTSISNLKNKSDSYYAGFRALADKTDKLNHSSVYKNIDTLRGNINKLSAALKNAGNINSSSKTYVDANQNVQKVDNQAKEYYNHPKGFSILGKSKKKK